MASRAIWKGQLRLSLVSIPVELHSATARGARPSFRQIHEPSGKPVRYQKTVKGIGPVNTDDIVKGYDTGDGEYVLIDPEEIDAIKIETKKTLELVQFVGACEIPPLYFDKPYYLVPTDDLAEDAYRVIRDALRAVGKIGLGQVTLRGKEYLAAIKPCGDGLLLETLHYEEEIRSADPLFSQIADEASDEELLELAETLIEKKTKPFDAGAYSDSYSEALQELLKAKTSSKKAKSTPKEGDGGSGDGENVVDLMSALKESVERSGKGSQSRKTTSSTKKTAGGKKGSGGRKKAS